jgi:hypothetical protein
MSRGAIFHICPKCFQQVMMTNKAVAPTNLWFIVFWLSSSIGGNWSEKINELTGVWSSSLWKIITIDSKIWLNTILVDSESLTNASWQEKKKSESFL